MTLTVRTTNTPNTPVQTVAMSVVQTKARQTGSPHASHSDIVGVTVPILTVNQTGLQYEQRRAAGGIEFRFNTGTLSLTLRQEIYMNNAASACERRIWEVHERAHVSDNVAILPQLDASIRRDATLSAIFIARQWRPRSQFQATQTAIQTAVGGVFRQLTGVAATRRDTTAEYARVRQQVANSCGP